MSSDAAVGTQRESVKLLQRMVSGERAECAEGPRKLPQIDPETCERASFKGPLGCGSLVLHIVTCIHAHVFSGCI